MVSSARSTDPRSFFYWYALEKIILAASFAVQHAYSSIYNQGLRGTTYGSEADKGIVAFWADPGTQGLSLVDAGLHDLDGATHVRGLKFIDNTLYAGGSDGWVRTKC
jgi:hypothetical protein